MTHGQAWFPSRETNYVYAVSVHASSLAVADEPVLQSTANVKAGSGRYSKIKSVDKLASKDSFCDKLSDVGKFAKHIYFWGISLAV